MGTLELDKDPVIELVWEHDGRRFRCRTVFASGFVSGPSEPLEAQGMADEGSYESPLDDGWVLMVGENTIRSFIELTSKTIKRDIHSVVDQYLRHDMLGRVCVMLRLDGQGRVGPATELKAPTFLASGWSGDRLQF